MSSRLPSVVPRASWKQLNAHGWIYSGHLYNLEKFTAPNVVCKLTNKIIHRLFGGLELTKKNESGHERKVLRAPQAAKFFGDIMCGAVGL